MNLSRLKHLFSTIALLVLVGTVLVWPLVTGFLLERNFGTILETLSVPNRWSLQETSFDRGWFHSEARTVLTLEGELARQMREARHTIDPRMPIQVILIHHIQHGPVISIERPFLLPAVALVETTVEFPQDTRDWLKPVFGQAPPVRLRSLIRLNGDVISRITSPSVEGDLMDGTHLQWQGIEGTLAVGHDGASVRGGMTMPLLALSDDAGQLRFQQLEIRLDNQRQQGGLWLGDTHLDLKTLAFMIPTNPEHRFSLNDFGAMSTFHEENRTLHAAVAMNLGELSIGGHPLGAGGFTIELRRVDLMAFSAIYNALKYWEQQPLANRERAEKQVRQTALAQLPALLQYSPELGITRFDVRTPQGGMQGNFRIQLSGEGNPSTVTPAEVFQRLRMDLELNAPLALVADVMQTQIMKEMIAQGGLTGGLLERDKLAQAARESASQRLAALVDQGLLTRYTDHYGVLATFAKGQLIVNDHPHNELLEKLKGLN